MMDTEISSIDLKKKTLQKHLNDLSEDGYVLLKNVVPLELIQELKICICEKLTKLGASIDASFSAQYKELSKIIHPVVLNKGLMRAIICEEFPKRLLTIPEILDIFFCTIGVDLAYETSSELPVNVKGELDDSLVKKFHQEFWSGAGYRTYSFWAPIFLEKGSGTMDMAKKSHAWGHIPHQNREPKWMPEDAEIIRIECSEGDALVFSSLTLHRTVKNLIECPRLSYTTTVRNVFENFSGFDMLSGWEVFHTGIASKTLKKCGNPHLSPFRTLGSKRTPVY
ncbi:MAG: hypothetical protein A3F12_00675 [Gammaproteobacteria bacterium RIFCSPHIGHO2_12_FULL_38_14]|nr:MAG: hypothetical protein A3F12_00675 [Gammaproteobacteria bacterium RIFCSPHIGHO2_12_FULL_38_14]